MSDDAGQSEAAQRTARHTPTRHAELEALPLDAVTLRVGSRVPRNLYAVTGEHPEGIDVGQVATAELAAEIVRRWNAVANIQWEHGSRARWAAGTEEASRAE